MPTHSRDWPVDGPGRRGVLLAALGAALLTGCGVEWDQIRRDDTPTPTPPELLPQDLARFAAVSTVQVLHDLAVAVAAGPATAPAAQRAAEQHAMHLQQLGPLPGPVPSASPTPSGWPTTASAPPVPTTLESLSQAEAAASTQLLGLALDSGGHELPGPLARLLSSVAASSAAHAVLTGAALTEAELPRDLAHSPGAGDDVVALIQADRAAAYGFGVLAVRLSGRSRQQAVAARAYHRQRARHLSELAVAAGVEVPAAPPAYTLERPRDAAAAAELAHRLELDMAAAAGLVVSSSSGGWRALGADVLVQATLRAADWGFPPAFPGIPELS